MNVPLARQACLTQVNQGLMILENRFYSLARYKYLVLIPFPLAKSFGVYCNNKHVLQDCLPLRWKPYEKVIQFLASNKLCFWCLSNQHISRFVPQRKTCKIANCSRKHPSILHTSPGENHTYNRHRCWHRRWRWRSSSWQLGQHPHRLWRRKTVQ